jgi:hypothetical protein
MLLDGEKIYFSERNGWSKKHYNTHTHTHTHIYIYMYMYIWICFLFILNNLFYYVVYLKKIYIQSVNV